MAKDYDYLLKVLLVGDSDVGKHEIMAGLEDGSTESPFCSGGGNCKWNFIVFVALFALNEIFIDDPLVHFQRTKRQQYYWMVNE